MSWLVYSDTMGGRGRLNFSEWTSPQLRRADEVARVIQEGEMPPAIYLPMHPSTHSPTAEKQQLITGLTNSLK